MLKKLPFVTRTYGLFNSKVRRCKKATSLAAGLAMTGLLAMNLPSPVQAQKLVPGLEQTGGQNPFGLSQSSNYFVEDHAFADIDGDSDSDLIFLEGTSSPGIYSLENYGDRYNPDFSYRVKGTNSAENILNLSGTGYAVSIDDADLYSDGYPEIGAVMQVGDTLSSETVIRVFNNDPATGVAPSDYFDIPLPPAAGGFDSDNRINDYRYLTLTFADIDGDNDDDAIVTVMNGNYDNGFGELDFVQIENVGNPTSPSFGVTASYGLPGISTNFPGYGSTAHLELVDVDKDGDLDAFLQLVNFNRFPKAEVFTYENTGSRYTASFQRDDNFFNTSDLGDFYLYRPPSSLDFVDYDGDKDFEVIIPRFSRYGSFLKSQAGFGQSADKLPGGYEAYWAAFENTLIDPNPNDGSDGYRSAELTRIQRSTPYAPYGLNCCFTIAGSLVDFDFVDFDNDGDYDFVYQDSESTRSLTVKYNDGDANDASFYGATISIPTPLTIRGGNLAFELGDLNGDGNLDAVVINSSSSVKDDAEKGTNNYYLNILNSDGRDFTEVSSIPLPYIDGDFTGFPPRLSLVDIDSDGDQDVVITTQSYNRDSYTGLQSSVYLYENYGSAIGPTFTGSIPLTLGRLIAAESEVIYGDASFADLDLDGDLDMTITGLDFRYGVPPQVGVAQFANVGDRTNPVFESTTRLFDPADIDFPDIYTKGSSLNQGFFSSEFVDLDGDNDADFVSYLTRGYGIDVHENVADNTKPPQFVDEEYIANTQYILSEYQYSNGVYLIDYNIRDIMLADIDSDGDLDLLAITETYYDLYNKSASKGGSPTSPPTVVSFEYRNSLQWIENTGDAVSPAFDRSIQLLASRNGTIDWDFNNPTLSDVDADGDLDLVFTLYRYNQALNNYYGPDFSFVPNTGSAIAPSFNFSTIEGFGDGINADNRYSQHAALGDFNGDNSIDALFEQYDPYNTTTSISVAYSTKNPNLVMDRVVYQFDGGYGNAHYTYLTPFDMDCDGDLDLVEEGYFDDDVLYIHFNEGSKTSFDIYGTRGVYERSLTIYEDEFTVGDIDGDGDPDLVMLSDTGSLYLLENISSDVGASNPEQPMYDPYFDQGYLPEFSFYDVTGGPQFVDLNRDGRLDILNDRYSEIEAYFNQARGVDRPYFRLYSGNPYSSYIGEISGYGYLGDSAFTTGDLNGDGDTDILAFYGGELIAFQNVGSVRSSVFFGSTPNPYGLTITGANFGSPSLVDIDTDGDLDLLISTYEFYSKGGGRGRYNAYVLAYENIGNASNPSFSRKNDAFTITIQGENFGYNHFVSRLEFLDFDRDGDLDFVAPAFDYANNYYFFIVGNNTGSATNPQFALSQENEFYGIPIESRTYIEFPRTKGEGIGYFQYIYAASISFGDLDSDGDYDALTGGEVAIFHENLADVLPIPYIAAGQENTYGLGFENSYYRTKTDDQKSEEKIISIGYQSPFSGGEELLDLDGDGDLDFLRAYAASRYQIIQDSQKGYGFTQQLGVLKVETNTGNATSPAFAVSDNYTTHALNIPERGEKIFSTSSRFIQTLSAADIDFDGDQDLFVSTEYYYYGNIGFKGNQIPEGEVFVDNYFFENTGDANNPAFATGIPIGNLYTSILDQGGGFIPGQYTIIDVGDMDGDGDYDILAGSNGFSPYPFFEVNYLYVIPGAIRDDFDKGLSFYITPGFAFGNAYNVQDFPPYLDLSFGGNLVDLDSDGDLDLVLGRSRNNEINLKGLPGYDYKAIEVLENTRLPYASGPIPSKGGGATGPVNYTYSSFIINKDATSYLPYYGINSTYYTIGDIVAGDIDRDGDVEFVSDQARFVLRKGAEPTGPTGPVFVPAIIFDGDYFPGTIDDDTPPYVSDPYDVADKSAEPYQYFYWDSPYDPESDISELLLEIADSDDFSNIVQTVDVTNLTQIGIELDEGPNFARLVATNGAGLTSTSGATDGVFIDSQQVIVTLDGVPIVTNNPNPTFTGTFMDPDPSSGMNSIEFRSKGNGLPSSMFQASFDNTETSSTWSGTQQIALPVEGVYDFQFRGIDCAFNRQFTVLEGAVIYDLTPPFVNDFRFVEIVNGGFARTSLTVELEYFDNLSDVTGFDPTDPSDLIITGPGGDLYPAPIQPGPDLFTFTIDPTIDGVEGEYTLRVPAGAAQDGAGNLSGPSQVLSFIYDVTPPELLCDAAFNTLGGIRQSGSSIFVTAEFTEPVIGFVPDAVSVSGAASFVGITPMPGPDTTYVIELDALSTGTATVALNNGFITDLAGNEFDATGVSTTFEIIPTPDMLPDPAPLFASDGASNDRFGQSVDLDGSVAIVGASGVGTVGAAYVLQATDPTTFTEVAKITSDDGAAGDNFGMSVGISGDWAIVGAPNDDDNDDSTGSVYFFKREVDDTPDPTKGLDPFIAEIWNQADKVLASDFATATDERLGRFGQVVAIDGQTAAVGRPLDARGGSVFVLELDICDGELGTWVPVQQIVPTDLTTRDNFGHSVAILGDVLVVGSRRDDDRGSDTGSVYVFRRNGGVWSQEQKIVPGDADRLDQIGTSVSRYANTIAFGSPGDDDLGSGAGAGYIYGNAVGSSWTVVDKLTTSFADSGAGFGTTIAHSGSNVALGAPFSDLINRDAGLIVNFSGDVTGAVKLLPAKPGISFTETPIIFSESMGRNDRAGSALAIDESVGILYGIPFSDAEGFNFGAVSFTGVEPDEID